MQNDVSDKVLGIVVPIYNTAAYLRECLDSIRFQTHENLCVLMVDDGSNDDQSLDIAREYVGLDSRFMLLCKENDGLSAARNTGLAWFKGEIALEYEGEENLKLGGGGGQVPQTLKKKTHNYKPTNSNPHRIKSFSTQLESAKPPKIDYILFFDSDDYLLPSFAQTCLSHSNGMDVVWCNYFFEYEIEIPNPLQSVGQIYGLKHSGRLDICDFIKNHASQVNFFALGNGHIIDFAFLRAIGLSFTYGIFAEDQDYGIKLLMQSKNTFYLNEQLSAYRIRPGSICNYEGSHRPCPVYFLRKYPKLEGRKNTGEVFYRGSFLLIFLEVLEFLQSYEGVGAKEAREVFLPKYAARALCVLDLSSDPLGFIPKLSLVLPYLEKPPKKLDILRIKYPFFNRLHRATLLSYEKIKWIERTIRRLLRRS